MGAGYVLRAGPAGAVVENFDSMGPTGTQAPGNGEHTFWSVNVSNTERATNLFVANTFPANGGFNGGPWAPPETDRALGVYAGAVGDNPRSMTMMITNLTGADLTRFLFQFDVEVWIVRNSGPQRYGGIQASFSADGVNWRDLGNAFEAVFQYPNTAEDSSANYWVNGNDPANSARNVGGWVENVNVPAGQVFYIRFDAHGATLTDPDGTGPYANRQIGVAVDNIRVEAEGGVAPPEVIIPAASLRYQQGSFSFTLPGTINGKNYVLEFSPSLPATQWTSIMTVQGNGQPVMFSHSAASNATGFYRLRVE